MSDFTDRQEILQQGAIYNWALAQSKPYQAAYRQAILDMVKAKDWQSLSSAWMSGFRTDSNMWYDSPKIASAVPFRLATATGKPATPYYKYTAPTMNTVALDVDGRALLKEAIRQGDTTQARASILSQDKQNREYAAAGAVINAAALVGAALILAPVVMASSPVAASPVGQALYAATGTTPSGIAISGMSTGVSTGFAAADTALGTIGSGAALGGLKAGLSGGNIGKGAEQGAKNSALDAAKPFVPAVNLPNLNLPKTGGAGMNLTLPNIVLPKLPSNPIGTQIEAALQGGINHAGAVLQGIIDNPAKLLPQPSPIAAAVAVNTQPQQQPATAAQAAQQPFTLPAMPAIVQNNQTAFIIGGVILLGFLGWKFKG